MNASRALISALLAAILSPPAVLAQEACVPCAGPVLEAAGDVSPAERPLVEVPGLDSSRAQLLESLSPELRRRTSSIFFLPETLATPEETLAAVDAVVDWLRSAAPVEGFGLDTRQIPGELASFAVKRAAATAQGEGLARQMLLSVSDLERLALLHRSGALAYVDTVVVPESLLAAALEWVATNDPARRVAVVGDLERPADAWFRAGELIAAGAGRVWLRRTPAASFVALNEALSGDVAADPATTATVLDGTGQALNQRVISFVQGSDLRTLTIPEPPASVPFIVQISDATAVRPQLVTSGGSTAATDSARRGADLLVGIGSDEPVAVAWERDLDLGEPVARESLEVAGSRTPTVEEIIRQHQAWARQQERLDTRWIVRNATTLRFSITAGERFEATFAGDQFHRVGGPNDWVWEELYLNGVRWKRTQIPEIPLVQPEKVTRLPLEILFTDDYEYELAGSRNLSGVAAWEVRFAPKPDARAGDEPLYRGTVWIDPVTFAPIRTERVQLGLAGGETLSNEETIDYAAFDRATSARMEPTAAHARPASELLWLPVRVSAQQVLSVVGRTMPVERRSDLSNVRIDPPAFDALLEEKSQSQLRMVRDTDEGMRYLGIDSAGERYVKDSTESSQYFLIGGLHHDEAFEYPVVPLGGINYFDFDFLDRGLQANVFFAGAILSATVTDPNVRGTRFNLGGDLFALAIPVENRMERDGVAIPGESVMNRPLILAARTGRPFLGFGKIDFAVGLNWLHFERADETYDWFEVPADTLVTTPGVDVRYERAGWLLSSFVERGFRSKWEPWGLSEEYSEEHKTYERWGATIGKSFFLPRFQRLGLELNWLDGANLDRFSKYELGFFGPQRVRGISSGSIRAEEALIAHISYGFVFSDQFRLEAYYDHALLSDAVAGWDREPLQGVGLSGQILGPWGTLVRLDLGKSIGQNAQDGFVADILFLKIFDPPWSRRNR